MHGFLLLAQHLSRNSHRSASMLVPGAMSISSSSSSAWTGWIVPRILPANSTEQSEAIASTTSLTSKYLIDPGVLCPGRGNTFHPFAPKDQSECSDNNLEMPNFFTPVPVPVNFETDTTSLDVYLYPPQNDEMRKRGTEPLHVLLDRSSQELVNKTLNRMVLSLNKQISKKMNKNTRKKKSKGQPQGSNQISDQSNSISVWKIGPPPSNTSLKNNDNHPFQPWNVQHMTNQQVWKEAIQTPVMVELQLVENITVQLQVDSCPPTIISVETFEDFEARVFCGIPLVLEVQALFATEVVIDWYVDNELVCENRASYTPTPGDIGKSISVLISPRRKQNLQVHKGRGYEQAFRFQHSVETLPENSILTLRQGDVWTNENWREISPTSNKDALRVCTYNILADQNAYSRSGSGKQQSFYPYVNLAILDKARRMPLILHEILTYSADVICLQEVDESVWNRLFRPVLEYFGYQGYFSSKIANGMHEGCAMLWNLKEFASLPKEEMHCYELNKLVLETSKDSARSSPWKSAAKIADVFQKKPDLKYVMEEKLGHVVQMVSLPLKETKPGRPRRLLVANTHLFYHPLGAHIRLMQMYAICRQFQAFQRQEGFSFPMILCGDMNSSLRRAAGYLLIHRKVLPSHSQIREHYNRYEWGDRKTNVATVGSGTDSNAALKRVEHTEQDDERDENWEDFPPIELPDHFPSFCAGYPTEPKFTHYLDSFAGSLDHIFLSQSSENNLYGLRPFRWAAMPSEAVITEHVAMPSEKLPSDHVSLVADVMFTKHHF